MDNTKLSDHEILSILQETKCYACGGRKTQMRAFCPKCYYDVPREIRNTLNRRFGDGFAQAFVDSLNALGREVEFVDLSPGAESEPQPTPETV